MSILKKCLGDIHGQLKDFAYIVKHFGTPKLNNKFLFLGYKMFSYTIYKFINTFFYL
jgi:hypothetical protein